MLRELRIRNFAVIDEAALQLGAGLVALTGETGAGKSILLDAFSLAIGGRGDTSLVRRGASQGQVTATFDLPGSHPMFALLADNGIVTGSCGTRHAMERDGGSAWESNPPNPT